MQAFGLARIGRDAELRYTAAGEAVANVSLAFSYGRKDEDGKRPTQWVDAALWGKRAEALSKYLTKGSLVSVTLDDLHIETFEGRNGPGSKLVGSISAIELAGGGERQESAPASKPPARNAAAPARKPAAQSNTGFDDLDDSIPF